MDYVSERRVSAISAKLLIEGGPMTVTNAVTVEIENWDYGSHGFLGETGHPSNGERVGEGIRYG